MIFFIILLFRGMVIVQNSFTKTVSWKFYRNRTKLSEQELAKSSQGNFNLVHLSAPLSVPKREDK